MHRALCWVVALSACTHAQAPKARVVGEVLSLTGVAGLIATAITTRITSDTPELLVGFSLMSIAGIATFATAELSQPGGETIRERNHRWAQILTERAIGAARDGRCPRVRHLEARVRFYDRDIHDLVFMQDAEIVKCMRTPEPDVVPAPVPETQVPDLDAAPDAGVVDAPP